MALGGFVLVSNMVDLMKNFQAEQRDGFIAVQSSASNSDTYILNTVGEGEYKVYPREESIIVRISGPDKAD